MSGRITRLELTPLDLPMRQPFVTALGSKQVTRNLRVTVRLEGGASGNGEASASLAWPDQTQEAMRQALEKTRPWLIGSEIERFQALAARGWREIGHLSASAAALECALLDAFTRTRGISLWKWFGGKRRAVVTSLTISAWPPPVAARAARRATRLGFRRLKVKLTGSDPDGDMERLLAVHRAAPRTTLWLDGNQGFTPERAVSFCRQVRRRRLPVRLFEQPVPRTAWAGLRQVEKEGMIPVVADESVRNAAEVRELIRRRAASAINVKLAKCGPSGALEIIRLAKKAGLRLMIGCMAESAAGLTPSVALACGTGAFDDVDLDSHLLVASPRGRSGFTTRGAVLRIGP